MSVCSLVLGLAKALVALFVLWHSHSANLETRLVVNRGSHAAYHELDVRK